MGAIQADALFVLGDLFEVWVGDDVLSHPNQGQFWQSCAQTLWQCSRRMPVYFMAGNRDFLVGQTLLQNAGMHWLEDPTVLEWSNHHRCLLTHGDWLCTQDTEYQRFRETVRSPAWQRSFLARPLAERLALAQQMRQESQATQAQPGRPWSDVDHSTVQRWLDDSGAQSIIHGHTHRAAQHPLTGGGQRVVLSDWDACATPARLSWLQVEVGADQHMIFKSKNQSIA